ncbi:class I SAM-dependent methyltransferase [Smaragdicoccus niigatensis]|uniref:class I SAM-dependent methyltransferase n=1 Tax=Smaragdicoccus niigatensis TaxID=359359 RepID=UPI00036F6E64|nr:class I SAM-dependent methyltransferase [Smaragdicoccus niigatensis]
MTQGYVFDQAWHDERARIAGMESLWDSGTIAVLDGLGIQPGWHCLEVGAGGGTIAHWLSERAMVTATDLDTRFVEPLASEMLLVSRHDIREDPLPPAEFDLIHTRLVLEHLPERLAIIDKLIAALKPGGVLVVEDYDWTSFGWTPSDERLERGVEAVFRLMQRAGFVPFYGRAVVGDLVAAGLLDVQGHGRALLIRMDHPGAAFFRLTLDALAPALVKAELISAEDAEYMQGQFADPAQRLMTPQMVVAIGRKA